MAQLSPSIFLSSTVSCLVCNKNTHNLLFNIYTTFLSKSKDVSVHAKIVQIVGSYNFNDKFCINNVLCMICFKILETIDVLECELKKQKNKIESQFRKSVEIRKNEANQQPILTNKIRNRMDRHTLNAFNNADDIIEPVEPISEASSEQVNDILSSFLATTEGHSQDSSSDLTCEQFISSLHTTDSHSRINFNQTECQDDLTQPIIEKLFTDDTGLNVIYKDNEDSLHTITITERQENKEIIESKESFKIKNFDNSSEVFTEDYLVKRLKTERKKSSDVKIHDKNKDNLSGHLSDSEDYPDEPDDQEDPNDSDASGYLPNETSDYKLDLKDKEKSNIENKNITISLKKRKRKKGHEIFIKTIKKEEISSIKSEDPQSPIAEQDLDDWDLSISTNSPTLKSITVNPFFCDLCDERFSTSIKLAKHREDVHSHILCHVCTDCGIRYREKAKLTRHVLLVHKVNPHHCQGCDYQAKSQNALDKHILEKHPESKYFECDICYKKFSTYRYLHVVHMKRCHFGLPIKYRCDICNKGFVDKTAIDNHKLTHSNVKDHTCEFCGAAFRSRYSLRVHRNSHTKEIEYPCSDCGANFLRNANLNAHKKRYHNSGDGKLVCEICGNSFLTKRALHRHQDSMHPNTNQKPFNCDVCEKSFYSNQKYKNHHKVHAIPQKYQCSLCPRVFAKKALLQRHMTSLHWPKTRIIVSKQNIMVKNNNLEQDLKNKQIHVKNVLPSDDNSGEKESVIIIVNNLEVNSLSLSDVVDQISDLKSNNSQTSIPQMLESPQNVKNILSINHNNTKNITSTNIPLPTPILLNTIDDNDNPLQLNTGESIISENTTIDYQEYINAGVTLQSAACIELDSENLNESHQNNFSNELLSGSRVLVPESDFTLITGDVNADEKQRPSLILGSTDVHNYSKQTSMLLSHQDDVHSGSFSTSALINKDIHNYSKPTPMLKLTSGISDNNSGPFSAVILTNKDVESSESSVLTLGDDNISGQSVGPLTKLTLSNKDIGRNNASESMSALNIPGEIVESESVENTLPLALVDEDLVENIGDKEHISLSFSAVDGAKEQHLVTEWF